MPYMVVGRMIVRSGVLTGGVVGPNAPMVDGQKTIAWWVLAVVCEQGTAPHTRHGVTP